MEGAFAKVIEAILAQGGIWAALALLILIGAGLILRMMYKELKATHAGWMADRQNTSEKRIEELKAHAAVIERNTAAHLEATRTNEGRAITLQRLVDDHVDHREHLASMKLNLESIIVELRRRGVL